MHINENMKKIRIKRNCNQCGKEFYIVPSRINNGRSKFCSRMCMGISRRKKNHPMWKGGLIKRVCTVCGKEFFVKPYIMKRDNPKFCSHKCMGIDRIKEKSFRWKGGDIKRTCKICGKEFFAKPAHIKIGKGKYCSNTCYGISERGSNHPKWKGGTIITALQIRSSYKYNEWHQRVFIRDNFTCQKCMDNTGGNLEAHHKKPFSQLIDEVKNYLPLLDLYEGAMLYIPLWDINNGITYCIKCHKKERKNKLRKDVI